MYHADEGIILLEKNISYLNFGVWDSQHFAFCMVNIQMHRHWKTGLIVSKAISGSKW